MFTVPDALWPACAVSVTLVADAAMAGAASTVMVAEAFLPSAVAVMVAVPAATAVTSPVPDTLALVVSELVQVTCRPLSALPEASRATAASCRVPPTWSVAVSGVTTSVAMGTCVTVSAASPLLPSLVALIVTGPAARAVTVTVAPSPLTVATTSLEVCQVKLRPVSALP
jgi:hypothetical protein